MQERLQKLIAAAGIASRRHAEELIESGEVAVNGEIVRTLERNKLLENTLIVVTSDNGGIPTPRDRGFGHDAVGGLRGSKSFIWEGGHRVPFVACWKGRIPAGTVRELKLS